MRKILLTLILSFVSGAVGWFICYFTYPEFSAEYIQLMNELSEEYPEWKDYVITPDEFEKLQDDVAYMREAAVDESEDFVFGVAYGTYRVMKIEHFDNPDVVQIKKANVIKAFLEKYPDKNWGINQKMADEIQAWVVEHPEEFK